MRTRYRLVRFPPPGVGKRKRTESTIIHTCHVLLVGMHTLASMHSIYAYYERSLLLATIAHHFSQNKINEFFKKYGFEQPDI